MQCDGSRRAVAPPGRQRGYATIFTLLLFAAVALAMFSMYDIGQTNTDKVRLQNAADAAAYSATGMMARDFNFIAYTNRAMVANQAAIGQMVGLASWASQMNQTATNLDRVASLISWVPYVGQAVKTLTRALARGSDVLERAMERASGVVIPALDVANRALSEGQRGYHVASIGLTYDTMTEVLEANEPDAELGLAGGVGFWTDFTNAWRGHLEDNRPDRLPRFGRDREFTIDRFREFTELVQDSTDGFTHRRRTRYWDFSSGFASVRMDKHGGNELHMRAPGNGRNDIRWDWSAMDTESLYFKDLTDDLFGGGWQETPIGWGAAHAKDHRARSRSYDYTKFHDERGFSRWTWTTPPDDRWGRSAWDNAGAASLAQTWDRTNRVGQVRGARTYHDFARDEDPRYNRGMEARDASDGPELGVYVYKPMDDVTTTDTLADEHDGFPESDRLDMSEKGGAAGDRLAALARAELYFRRPSDLWPKEGSRAGRYNGRVEHGNLYNPYWQVRLVEPSTGQRIAALADSYGGGLGNLFR